MKHSATRAWFAVLFCTGSMSAQGPDVAWTCVLGGPSADEGYSVRETIDGGYIITGLTSSFGAGSADVYLVRTNSSGDTLWTETFGGASSDWGECVEQSSDGGFIVAGVTNSLSDSADVFLVKTDEGGDTSWTTAIGGEYDDEAYAVQQTNDGGYIITGSTKSYGAGGNDVYLVRTDSDGSVIWERTYGGSDSDIGAFVQQTTDGGFIVAGSTASFGAGSEDVFLIRTNSNGDTLWTRYIGGSLSDVGYYVQETNDGGYIITGFTKSFGAGGKDVYLVKTDAEGNQLWSNAFGGTDLDSGEAVCQTEDGGYILTGFTKSYGAGNSDVYLVRTNSSGDALWTQTVGGAQYDRCNSIQQTVNGGYIAGGLTLSWGAGSSDVYLIKLDSENGIVSLGDVMPSLDVIYPNPFSSSLTIKYSIPEETLAEISVFDVSGRLVDRMNSGLLSAGQHLTQWFPSPDTPVGCYVVVLDACGCHTLARCLKLN